MPDLKKLQRKTKLGTIMADDILLKAENIRYIDTGVYALNKIVCGKLHGGIPVGKVITFNGESGVGKSYFTARCMRSFQKDGGAVILLETENAMDETFYKRVGVDVNNILWESIDSVGDMQTVMLKYLSVVIDEIQAEKDKFVKEHPDIEWNPVKHSDHYGKYLFVVDSLGNLMSKKEKADNEKGKLATDMGSKAKDLRAFGKAIIPKLRESGATLLCTNHVYVDASGYVPKHIASGGGGPEYISHTIVFFKKGKLKDDREIVGNLIKASTEKNRLTVPFQSCEIELSYKHGLNKYSYIKEMLIDAGIIKQNGSRYIVNIEGQEKSLYWKDIEPKIEELGFIDQLEQYYENEGYFDETKCNNDPENDNITSFDNSSADLTIDEYNKMSVAEIKEYIKNCPECKETVMSYELSGKKRKSILSL